MTFEENLAFGREIEKAVARWLMMRGLLILPVYDYSGLAEGKAPKLTAAIATNSLILPDLLGAKDGKMIWFEVKFKHRADFTHISKRLETGISARLWDHYGMVEKESGCPVWLIFAHRLEDEIRAGSLSDLRETARLYSGNKMGKGGMVFFGYDNLRLLSKFSDVIQPQ